MSQARRPHRPSGVEVLVVLAPSPTVSIPLRDDFVQPFFVRQLDVTCAMAAAEQRRSNTTPPAVLVVGAS